MGRNRSKEGKNREKVKNLLDEVFDLLCRYGITGCFWRVFRLTPKAFKR